MRTPRLSAECSIGPALGQYRAVPSGDGPSADGSAALAPMVVGVLRRQANFGPGEWQRVYSLWNSGRSPCARGEQVCWTTSTADGRWLDYICCRQDQACAHLADGTPFCQGGNAQLAYVGVPLASPAA